MMKATILFKYINVISKFQNADKIRCICIKARNASKEENDEGMMRRKSLGSVVGIGKAEKQLSLTDNLCAVPEMFPFSTFSIPGR